MVDFPKNDVRKTIDNLWVVEYEAGESVTVPVGLIITLKEVPDDGTLEDRPLIEGLTETLDYPPTSGYFYVNYGNGKIAFNDAQVGQTFSVAYWKKGSLVDADDINWLYNKAIESPTITLTGDVSGSIVMVEKGNVTIPTILTVEVSAGGVSSWNDLTDIPESFTPSVHTQDWNTITNTPSAFTPEDHQHDYNELENIPPSAAPEWDDIVDKPTEFTPEAHTQDWNTITNTPTAFPYEDHEHVLKNIEIDEYYNIEENPYTFCNSITTTSLPGSATDYSSMCALKISSVNQINNTDYTMSTTGTLLNVSNMGDSNNLAGQMIGVTNDSLSTVDTALGLYSMVGAFSEGLITNLYNLYVESLEFPSGRIANSYGLFIGVQSGTNIWGIYQTFANAKNYFAGNVGIGNNDPQTALEVNGIVTATSFAGDLSWSYLTDVPDTFPPSAHTQDWDTITDTPSAFTPEDHQHGSDDIISLPWSKITSIPDSTITLSGAASGFGTMTDLGNVSITVSIGHTLLTDLLQDTHTQYALLTGRNNDVLHLDTLSAFDSSGLSIVDDADGLAIFVQDSTLNIGLGQTTFGTSAAKVLAIGNGIAPSTSPADAVQMWSADRGDTAGKAGLHIRSEDGTSHVFSDKVGIGTVTPYSTSLLTLYGTDASDILGPNLAIFTSASTTYPLFYMLNWGADNISICFDSYFASAFKSSDYGSNYMIRKVSDAFSIQYDSEIYPGNNITWNTALHITVDGNIGLCQTTFGNGAIKVIAIGNGTAPATSPADAVQMWSADRGYAAGKSGLHIRSEDGTSHVFSDRVGIGTITPTYNFHLYSTQSIADASMYSAYFASTFNGTLTGNYSGLGIGNLVTNNITLGANTSTIYGIYNYVSNPVGYLCSNLYGLVSVASSLHTTDAIAYAIGIQANVTHNGAGGTVSAAYAGYFSVTQTAGTITTGYGVYIATVQGTTNWGLYQVDASNKNYFAGNVGIGTTTFNATATNTLIIKSGTVPDGGVADCAQIYCADQAAGNACIHTRTEGGAIVKLFQGAALTAQLTTITHTAPAADDFAIQGITSTSPFGFVNANEGNTVLKVIANLQTRVAELETRLKAHGLLA